MSEPIFDAQRAERIKLLSDAINKNGVSINDNLLLFKTEGADIDRLRHEISVFGKIELTRIDQWVEMIYKIAQTTFVSNRLYVHGVLRDIRYKVAAGENIEAIERYIDELGNLLAVNEKTPASREANGGNV